MRLITLYTLLMLLSVTPCLAQEPVRIDVHSFKESGDSLLVDYFLRVPSQSVKSSQGLRITPMVEAGDSVLQLPHITILGKNKDKVFKRYQHNRKAGKKVSSLSPDDLAYAYQVRVPYQLWMDSARLCIRQEVANYRGHKLITRYQLHDKVELEKKEPYSVKPMVAFITPQKEEKRRKRQGKAYLDFQAGRSVIIPSYRRNPEELQKIDEAINEVVSNKDVVLRGLYVEGFASPEGSYALNERLSGERATALKEYIKQKFSLKEGLFEVSLTAEDWEGLEVLVNASELNNKDKVLEIITALQLPDIKEAALKGLGVTYRTMLKDLFPELRRVEYQIDYTVKDYNVMQTKELLERNHFDLSQYELYKLAQTMEKGSRQYNDLFLELIPRQFADDATAHNNAAAVLIANGETTTAKRHLEKAGDSPQSLNNRGILSMLEGDLDKAEAYFDKAQEGGNKEAALNKKEVDAKRRDNIRMERYKNRK